jgi:hypothetical protein
MLPALTPLRVVLWMAVGVFRYVASGQKNSNTMSGSGSIETGQDTGKDLLRSLREA